MKIGTWNVEYAAGADKNERRRAVLQKHDCDVWVLTETHDELAPTADHTAVHSAQRPTGRLGGRWVSIWTRFRVLQQLDVVDPNSAPVSCVVLSAALAEGALTFAAKHARDMQLGAFQSSNFDREPKDWRAEKLIESAAAGAGPILTAPIRARAEHLHRTRQRVHAGRMLGEYPARPPDLRPEEGRDAKATAEQIVRAVLDWLERQPQA